jgi:hypothetical protein
VVKILDCQDPLELQGMTHLVRQVSYHRLMIGRSDCSYIVKEVSAVLRCYVTAEYKATVKIEGVCSSYNVGTLDYFYPEEDVCIYHC